MTEVRFNKAFTQQEPLPEKAIARAVEVMQSGRLHRYNVVDGETSEAAALERDFAGYMGQQYCLACASGGYAIHIALKAAGVARGDRVLTNAFTLAPVPGAIDNAGAIAVLVEIDDNYCVDLEHLEACMRKTNARYFLMSHMRGHIADMHAVVALCKKHEVILIEDCAHTMGARFDDVLSGTFGQVACFSTQTYKHMNSGEGGFVTTNDPQVMARATVYSGSYMLYDRHGTVPPTDTFADIKLNTPNYSGRMDNLRAALLRVQLEHLNDNCERWNKRYRELECVLATSNRITLPVRSTQESFVGSSLQFRINDLAPEEATAFIAACAKRGVEVKWFGASDPHGFTSRYDSWQYLPELPELPNTLAILSNTFDVRIPLTFTPEDLRLIGQIICEASSCDATQRQLGAAP